MNMSQLFSIGQSNLNAIQKGLDTTSNNIANANTTGYQTQEMSFHELIHNAITNDEVITNNPGFSVTRGNASSVQSQKIEQGGLQATGRSLDLAIEGNSFFAATAPDGNIYYTRAGDFHQDSDQRLVTKEGWPVMMNSIIPNAQWPKGTIEIDQSGNITISSNNQQTTVGKIGLFQIPNTEQLSKTDRGYFQANDTPVFSSLTQGGNFGRIRSGYLENSTVDLAKEMTDLIVLQRIYGMNTKAVQTADELWQVANRFTE